MGIDPLSAGTAWVLTSEASLGSDLAAGLADLGCRVTLVVAAASLAVLTTRITSIAADFNSRAALNATLSNVLGDSGPPSLVVLALMPNSSLLPAALDEMDAAAWRQCCHVPLKQSLFALQACQDVLQDQPVALVGLGPTVGLVGAPRLTALCAALEGQRALFKAVARQWGARGVTANWIAIAPVVFAPRLAQAELPQVPELGPPPLPLGKPPGLRNEVAAAAWFFATKAGRTVTGTTITLDGGEWMVP